MSDVDFSSVEIPCAASDAIASWSSVLGHTHDDDGKLSNFRRASVEVLRLAENENAPTRVAIIDSLAAMAVSAGIDDGIAQTIMVEAKDVPDDEVIWSDEKSSRQTPALLPLRWHGEQTDDADYRWLVKFLLPEVGTALLPGQWGTAKTFVAINLSASVMTGRPFAGRRVARQGGVLFIAAEGSFEIPIRLKGLMQATLADLPNAEHLPFVWCEQCPRLLDRDALAQLEQTAQAAAERMQSKWGMPLALIIIDTLAAAASFKDESSAGEGQAAMNVLAGVARRMGACVLAVDHFGKAVETGTRGTSAKEAAADAVIALLGERDIAGNISNLRMAVRKLRGGLTGSETSFSLDVVDLGIDRDGDPVTTCVVRWNDTPRPAAAAPAKFDRWSRPLQTFRRAMMTVLADQGAEQRPYGNDGPLVRAVDREIIRGEFYRIYAADGETEQQRREAKRKQFARNLRDAADKGLIGLREAEDVMVVWLVSPTEGVEPGRS